MANIDTDVQPGDLRQTREICRFHDLYNMTDHGNYPLEETTKVDQALVIVVSVVLHRSISTLAFCVTPGRAGWTYDWDVPFMVERSH